MNATESSTTNNKNALGVTYEIANVVGDRLRVARERQRLSPTQISSRVKIRDRYIEAIEIGDWDVLPPGLNGRGLIRLYAKELGVALPEFDEFHNAQNSNHKYSDQVVVSTSARSKYHSSINEPSEFIRSIPRNSTSPQNSSFSGAIVTPNVYDVLGITKQDKPIDQKYENIGTLGHTSTETGDSQNNENDKVDEFSSFRNTESKVPKIKAFFSEEELQSERKFNIKEDAQDKEQIKDKLIGKNVLNSDVFTNNELKRIKKLISISPVKLVSGLTVAACVIFFILYQASKQSLVNTEKQDLLEESIPIPREQLKENSQSGNTAMQSQASNQANASLNNKTDNKPDSKVETQPVGQTQADDQAEKDKQIDSDNTLPTDAAIFPGLSVKSNVLASKNNYLEKSNSESVAIVRTAKLNILSKVRVEIEADGEQIFSGIRSSGFIEIPLKQRAEVTIYDASKTTLTYEGWDLGVLGNLGRKRKIIINAEPYVE